MVHKTIQNFLQINMFSWRNNLHIFFMIMNVSLFIALPSIVSVSFDNNFDFPLRSLIKISYIKLKILTLNSLKVYLFAQKIVIMLKVCDITKYWPRIFGKQYLEFFYLKLKSFFHSLRQLRNTRKITKM